MTTKGDSQPTDDRPGHEADVDGRPSKRTRRRRRRLVILLLVIAYATWAYWPVENRITVSRETTYLTGPLNEDGTVDYAEALRQRYGSNVTPENNALVLLCRAIGPSIYWEDVREEKLAALGVPSMSADGDYLVGFPGYVGALPDAEREACLDEDGNELHWDMLFEARRRPWSAEEFPVIARWLESIEGPLALATQAAGRSKYYDPILSSRPGSASLFQHTSVNVMSLRRIAEAMLVRAMLRAESGDTASALADVMTCHQLGRLFRQAPIRLERLMASGFEMAAFRAYRQLIAQGLISAEQAEGILADLQSLPMAPSLAEGLLLTDRLRVLDCAAALAHGVDIDRLFSSEEPVCGEASYPLVWDDVLRELNTVFDEATEAAMLPGHAESLAASESIEAKYRRGHHGKADTFLGNLLQWLRSRSAPPSPLDTVTVPIGRFKRAAWSARVGGRTFRGLATQGASRSLARLFCPSAGGRILHDMLMTEREITELSLALLLHRHEHGQYPMALEHVDSKYLSSIPPDRFSDQPLRYERRGNGYLLYSVGPDMEDDGGVDVDGESADDDIVIYVK